MDSLTVGLVAICRVKFAGETRDAVASLDPTAKEARITCAIVDAAAKLRLGKDGITIWYPNRAAEGG